MGLLAINQRPVARTRNHTLHAVIHTQWAEPKGETRRCATVAEKHDEIC